MADDDAFWASVDISAVDQMVASLKSAKTAIPSASAPPLQKNQLSARAQAPAPRPVAPKAFYAPVKSELKAAKKPLSARAQAPAPRPVAPKAFYAPVKNELKAAKKVAQFTPYSDPAPPPNKNPLSAPAAAPKAESQAPGCWPSLTSAGAKRPAVENGPVLETLGKYFGYSSFRPGQQETIEAALAGRDSVLLWATGHGKSIPYQLVALHTGKTVVVVSPLISLMQDQVTNLNNKAGAVDGRPVAAFLGSAQVDHRVEAAAYRGEYRVVYTTPEKLVGFGGLESFACDIALVAIDEAHCVSEWGHDFRPAYKRLGQIRASLGSKVPIMALTATATPVVRADIETSLALRDALVSQLSLDRKNLEIVVRPLGGGGTSSELAKLARELSAEAARGSCDAEVGATIIYCGTIREVEEHAAGLRRHLEAKRSSARAAAVTVGMYHGRMLPSERHATHLAFLSGTMHVVVATLAFGMGIDKPDIRRIVHLGPPKTCEEYTQQIGRAGRDGLASRCELVWTGAGFTRYESEFYTRELKGKALEVRKKSTRRLRQYAEDSVECRRKAIAAWFGQDFTSGPGCSCDNCRRRVEHAGDMERDYSAAARIVLRVLPDEGRFGLAMTRVKNALNTDALKRERCEQLGDKIQRSVDFLTALIPELVKKGLVARNIFKGAHSSYAVFNATIQGRASRRPIVLPVPTAIREMEREAKQRVTARLDELRAEGIALDQIPPDELEKGEGRMLNAELAWVRRMKAYRDRGDTQRLEGMAELLRRVLAWRARTAVDLSMAPGAVLTTGLARKVVLSGVSSAIALRDAGVRIRGVEELAATLDASRTELGLATQSMPTGDGAASQSTRIDSYALVAVSQVPDDHALKSSPASLSRSLELFGHEGGFKDGSALIHPHEWTGAAGPVLVLPAGNFTPTHAWAHAKPPNPKRPPSWIQSYQRWVGGESTGAIALKREPVGLFAFVREHAPLAAEPCGRLYGNARGTYAWCVANIC